MTGADLRCNTCGSPAADVAPDYEIGPEADPLVLVSGGAVAWTCTDGHQQITGWGTLDRPAREAE